MRRRPSRSGDVTLEVLLGAIGGVVATAAMTLAAERLFRRLPPAERYPLPPRELTGPILAGRGRRRRASEPAVQAMTLVSHFGFGAATGAASGPLLARTSHTVPLGIGWGLAVWTVSYLGWIPALGLLRPATEHPARRNALMIAVHIVWGATLGWVTGQLSRALAPVSGGPLRDRPGSTGHAACVPGEP